jgi:hypothetical protein
MEYTEILNSIFNKLETERDVNRLINILHFNKIKENKIRAIEILGRIKDKRAVEPLIRVLADPDGELRETAVKVLGEIGDARAMEPLIVALKKERAYKVLTSIKNALCKIADDGAVEALIELLESESGELVIGFTNEILGNIRDLRAVEPLIEKLKDNELFTRNLAAKALAKIGDKRAVSHILEALGSRIGRRNFLSDKSFDIFCGKYSGIMGGIFSWDCSNDDVLELCKIQSKVSSNMLHHVTSLQESDLDFTSLQYEDQSYLDKSFAGGRRIASEELKRRGNPAYNQDYFLDEDEWNK